MTTLQEVLRHPSCNSLAYCRKTDYESGKHVCELHDFMDVVTAEKGNETEVRYALEAFGKFLSLLDEMPDFNEVRHIRFYETWLLSQYMYYKGEYEREQDHKKQLKPVSDFIDIFIQVTKDEREHEVAQGVEPPTSEIPIKDLEDMLGHFAEQYTNHLTN